MLRLQSNVPVQVLVDCGAPGNPRQWVGSDSDASAVPVEIVGQQPYQAEVCGRRPEGGVRRAFEEDQWRAMGVGCRERVFDEPGADAPVLEL